MNGTSDTSGTAAVGNGDGFGPQEAATLLDEARRQARRQFEATPPWLSLIQAVVVLGAYGAIWLSVRGQHPYPAATRLVPQGQGTTRAPDRTSGMSRNAAAPSRLNPR
jgi:hypothetical protein